LAENLPTRFLDWSVQQANSSMPTVDPAHPVDGFFEGNRHAGCPTGRNGGAIAHRGALGGI